LVEIPARTRFRAADRRRSWNSISWENGYNESFNGKLKDELIDREIFYSLREAQVLVEQWRREYNTMRSRSVLGHRPPASEAVRPSSWSLKRPSLLGPPERPRVAAGLT
jgi:transposase InsO family protein